jgi:hypothetical protein
MSEMTTMAGTVPVTAACAPATRVTRALLGYGVIAGPVYLIVGLIEAFTRSGFDITRDDLSLLSNGSLGWIHITLLVITGLMTVAGAIGMRRALAGGAGGTWGPRLVGAYGAGLIAAGTLVADPMDGFPRGHPGGTGRPPLLARHRAPGRGRSRVLLPDPGVLRPGPPVRCEPSARLGGLLPDHWCGLRRRLRGRRQRVGQPRGRARALGGRRGGLGLGVSGLGPAVCRRRDDRPQ